MKKLTLLSILLWGFPLLTYAVSPFVGWDDEETGKMAKGALLDPLLRGKVDVTVSVPDGIKAQQAQYEQFVAQAIKQWTIIPVRIIREERRIAEFSDIYDKLSRGVQVSFKPGAALKVVFYDDLEEFTDVCGDADACYVFETNTVVMLQKEVFNEKSHLGHDKDGFKNVLIHELGHALGLEDQYPDALYNGMASWIHSSPNTDEGSVMMGGSHTINCDDVDGLIYEIDQYYVTPQSKKRPQWVSLCGGHTYAPNQYDVKQNENKFDVQFKEDQGSGFEWIIWHKSGTRFKLDKNSTFNAWQKVIDTPLQFTGKLENRNYEFETVGPNQETVKVYTIFDKTWCFAYLDGEPVWAELFERGSKSGKDKESVITRHLYFGGKGAVTEITWFLLSDLSLSLISYTEHVSADQDNNFSVTGLCDIGALEKTKKCGPLDIFSDSKKKDSVRFTFEGNAPKTGAGPCRDISCSVQKQVQKSQLENQLQQWADNLSRKAVAQFVR